MGDFRVTVMCLLENLLTKGTVEEPVKSCGVCAYSIIVKSHLVCGHGQCFIEPVNIGVVHRGLPRPIGTKNDSF